MTKKEYALKRLKDQLREKKNRGCKSLIWKLNKDQKEFVQNLGFKVDPYLYEITTKTFYNIRSLKSTLLKDIHFLNKRGKQFEVRKLNKNEKQLLEENGIRYRVVKYKIYLY